MKVAILDAAQFRDATDKDYSSGKRNSLASAPRQLPAAATVALPSHAHGCEVQSVAAITKATPEGCRRTWIGSIDARGHGVVACYDTAALLQCVNGSSPSPLDAYSFTIPHVVESGWAGIALACDSPWRAAAAHMFGKSLAVFKRVGSGASEQSPTFSSATTSQGELVGCIATQGAPTALTFTSPNCGQAGSHLVAVAEGGSLAIYDVTSPRPCVARETPGPAGAINCVLYSLSASGAYVTAAGSGAAVYVYDVRGLHTSASAAAAADASSGGALAAASDADNAKGQKKGGGATSSPGGALAPLPAPIRWLCPAKYDVTGVALALGRDIHHNNSNGAATDNNSGLVFVVGADQEVLCGPWESAAAAAAAAAAGTASGGDATNISMKRKRPHAAFSGGGGGEGRALHAGGFTGRDHHGRQDTAAHALAPSSSPGAASSGSTTQQQQGELLLVETPLADAIVKAQEGSNAPSISNASSSNSAVPTDSGTTASAAGGNGAPGRVGAATASGFRGDSRWVGLALTSSSSSSGAGDSYDAAAAVATNAAGRSSASTINGGLVLLALTEGGWGYLVTHAQRMSMSIGGHR